MGDAKEGKYVGMFFWTYASFSELPRNVTEILKEHPDIIHDYNAKQWGGPTFILLEQPIYGYYNGKDHLGV